MSERLVPNSTISHYRIVSRIGAGGMGEVYLADDTHLHRRVALKVLPQDIAADADRLLRFEREAFAASSLNHPNILTIFEFGSHGQTHFLASEFVDGESLRERVGRATMTFVEALDIGIQIASALQAAHVAGIVHRDIKPENVMIRADGYVKVLDFGLAKLSEAIATGSEEATRKQLRTQAGIIMGTAAYMSPEQARGLEVDRRTDVWSLGCVLYEMLTRQPPFRGDTTTDVLANIIHSEPIPIRELRRDANDELDRIISKVLCKNREERYQTAKDLSVDLKQLQKRLEFEAELQRSSQSDIKTEVHNQLIPVLPSNESLLKGAPEQSLNVEGSAAPATVNGRVLNTAIHANRRSVIIALATLIIIVATAGAYLYFTRARSGAINSVAVLPFANTSNDPNIDYLSDGISEVLINSLTELKQLRVIARSTVFRYKGKEIDPQTIGRELNVRALLMGRVRQVGDNLNIQVDLVDTSTGAELWGQEYERRTSDVLSVKQDIAREVTNKLRLRLSGDEQNQLTKRDTANAESFQFYLRGRYYWNKRSAEGIKKAIEQFQQAIDRDPNYALGYVGLADCYLALELYAGVPASEIVPKARASVDRALQLDDSLSEAHATSSFINQKMWRWGEAEEEIKRAISLNPNYPTAHHWYAYYFYIMRQFDDAMREINQAYQLDPLSPVISENVALVHLLKNDLNSAIDQCRKTIELDPGFADAHYILAFAYLKQGRNDEALAEFQKSVELSGGASTYLGNLGYCYAVTGRRAEALKILKELEERYAQGKSSGQFIAEVYAGLDDKNEALEWLEKDFQQRSGQLPTIAWRLHFDSLRGDRRYQDLLRRMGLSP